MKISFITPSYNNLKYLQLCHDSLKNQLKHIKSFEWEHCIADDGSSDGTLEWLNAESKKDNTIKFIRKEKRIGHTELYNELVNEIATGNIIMIFHADMFLCTPNTIENMLRCLKEKRIVSATRVEPEGMYPESPEKLIKDFGDLTVGKFNRKLVEDTVKNCEDPIYIKMYTKLDIPEIKSIFAPWMCYKKDYLPMDPIFSPFPHEDEDVFVRQILNGMDVIQRLDACVAHFCSRGHRRTDENDPTKDNNDYAYYENKARRNYIRKWQSWVKFKEYQYPIIPKLYDLGLVIKNCKYKNYLALFEPWCSTIYIEDKNLIESYISTEQKETLFDLRKKVRHINDNHINDIIVECDANLLTVNDVSLIYTLSEIITDSGEIGEMELGIFKLFIKNMNTYENNLIHLDNPYYKNKLV